MLDFPGCLLSPRLQGPFCTARSPLSPLGVSFDSKFLNSPSCHHFTKCDTESTESRGKNPFTLSSNLKVQIPCPDQHCLKVTNPDTWLPRSSWRFSSTFLALLRCSHPFRQTSGEEDHGGAFERVEKKKGGEFTVQN